MNRRHFLPKISLACLVAVASAGILGDARAADPTTVDCLTASENSITMRSQHKLRAARSELLVCAAPNCPADVRTECMRRVEEVNAAMPTIVFEAKDSSGSDVSGVKVTMDGQPLIERLEGTALSIDPGEHAFVFEAPGQPPLQKQFVIVEGVKDRRERIVFGSSAAPTAVSQSPGATGAVAATTGGSGVAADTGSNGDTQRILGWSAAGLGVVGLGLGIVFEIKRGSKASDADAICPSGANCPAGSNASIQSLNDEAKSAATLGAVSLIAGGVLVAGGLTLVFTAPHSKSGEVAALPVVGPDFQGVMVRGQVW